jgi:hypothetical protein
MPDPQADIVVRPSGMMTDTRSPKFRMSTLNEFRLEGDDRTVWILYAVLPHMAQLVACFPRRLNLSASRIRTGLDDAGGRIG